MKRIERLLPLFVIWALAVGSPLWAAPQQNGVLGANGEVYIAKAGTYGELFPGGREEIDAATPVLALEVTHPDGSLERLLVEGTDTADQERLPFLLYEESSRTVFLLWETQRNSIHPILILSGYDGSWIDPVEIIGDPFAPKASPQFAITHETLQVSGTDGAEVTRHQTVLHIVWGEELANDSIEAFYAPVIFDDGVRVEHGKVFKLSDFDKGADAAPDFSPGIRQALAISRGRDERTVVVAFPSQRTQRLVTLEIDVLPAQLGRLADEARMHIVDLGAKHSWPAGYKKVADLARMHIVDLGAKGFQAEVVQAMAQQVSELILKNQGADKIEVIADRARMHIVDLGAKLSDRGLRTSASTVQIQEISEQGLGQGSPKARPPALQLLNFRLGSSWPAPTVDSTDVRLFPARSGSALLIAWPEDGKIQYLETQEGGWSRVKEMALTPALDLNRAYHILEDRMSRN